MKVRFETPVIPADGTAYGYYLMTKAFYERLPHFGIEYDDNAKTVLHFREPKRYEPVAGRRNVLFTMWESDVIDPIRHANIQKADEIITCSTYCRDVLSRFGGRVRAVVPLGVDTKSFAYVKRKLTWPAIVMWIGAPNARKGWDTLGHVVNTYFCGVKDVVFYFKTTGMRQGMVEYHSNNVVIDYRNLPTLELAKLIQRAHIFALPTQSEGFGLTALEAMATGCPTITTRYSGVLDFATRRNAYLLDYKFVTVGTSEGNDFQACAPDPVHLKNTIVSILGNYDDALRVGKEAHRTAQEYTWDNAARKLAVALRRL